MNTPTSTITEDQMLDALKRSGYPHEMRCGQVLEKAGWTVGLNFPYLQNEDGVPRELDILAEKILMLTNGGSVRSIIVAECINNPQPFVLFERRLQDHANHSFCVQLGGWPTHFIMPDADHLLPLCHEGAFATWHHYCTTPLAATQFCSFVAKKQGKGDEWQAIHEGTHFTALSTPFEAIQHLRQRYLPHIRNSALGGAAELLLFFPVVVLHGDLLAAIQDGATLALEPRNRGLLRTSTVVGLRAQPRIIDVLHEDSLKAFAEQALGEAEIVKELFNREHVRVARTIDFMSRKMGEYRLASQHATSTQQRPPPLPDFAL